MIWKVFVSAVGEDCDGHGWHTNGLEFATKEEADKWGEDLLGRWFGAKEFRSVQMEAGTPSSTRLNIREWWNNSELS